MDEEKSDFKVPSPRVPPTDAFTPAAAGRSSAGLNARESELERAHGSFSASSCGSTPRSSRRNSSSFVACTSNTSRSMSISTPRSGSAHNRRASNSPDVAALDIESENVFAQAANSSAGRKRQRERDNAAANASIVHAVHEVIAEMPPNSVLRPQLIASVVEKSNLKQSVVAEKLGVSTTTVGRALQSDDRSAANMHRTRTAKAPRVKSDEALAFAKQFWIDMSRQTQKRDENGERLDIYYFDVNQDEIYDAYKLRVVEAYMADHEEVDVDSFAAGVSGDVEHLLFEKICTDREALRRSKFMSVRPKNVRKGEIRECSCGTCNEGFSIVTELELRRDELHAGCIANGGDVEECPSRSKRSRKPEVVEQHTASSCPVAAKDKRVQQLAKEEALFQVHRERAREQRLHFMSLRDGGMAKGEALLLFDFSPYNSAYRHRRTLDEGMTGVQCLHIVLFAGNGEGGSEKYYYDYFSEDSNDYYFFRAAMLDFCQRDEIKKLQIKHYVSDGGPKHFKIRRSIGFALVELPLLLGWSERPEWHFFEASHGKNECDSRAAVVKYFLKRLALRGKPSEGAAGIAKNIQSSFDQKLTHRNATALGMFDKSTEFDWKEFGSVRKWHLLQWTGKETKVAAVAGNTSGRAFIIRCLETSTTNDAIVEQVAVPKYKIESLAAGEQRRLATISKKEKNKRKRDSVKNAKSAATKAIVGVVDAMETLIDTDLKQYTAGTIVAVEYDKVWYVGKIKKVGTQYIGRRKLATSDKKVEVYIKRMLVYFIDPFEREGLPIRETYIELQKNTLDFVDDVRRVKGDKFNKCFK